MKVLLFGATGAAGGSVLKACLAAPDVDEVRVIGRRPPRISSPKIRFTAHTNFLDFSAAREAFTCVDACLFCLGVSATQTSGEQEYRTITHDYTLAAATLLKSASPGAAFHYITGQGTNPAGRMMWQKVKGQTENELIALLEATCWRPAAIDGEPSDSAPWLYQVLRPLFVLARPFRSLYIHGEDLGRAMLHATRHRIRGRVIENAEIRDLAEQAAAEVS